MPASQPPPDFYARNFPYLIEGEARRLKDTTVLVAGLGIGSVISEGLVRLGVGRLILIDGDRVEESNLNRQNYIRADVGSYKAEALARYLKSIGGCTEIEARTEWFEAGNADELLRRSDLALNTIDFEHPMCLGMHAICRKYDVPMLFPMNLGWASVLLVFSHTRPEGPDLSAWLSRDPQTTDAESIVQNLTFELLKRNELPDWWLEVWQRYQDLRPEKEPQLHVGCSLLSARVSSVLYDWSRGARLPDFPYAIFMDGRRYQGERPTLMSRLKSWILRRRLNVRPYDEPAETRRTAAAESSPDES